MQIVVLDKLISIIKISGKFSYFLRSMYLLTNSILVNIIHNVHGFANPKYRLKIIDMGKILTVC